MALPDVDLSAHTPPNAKEPTREAAEGSLLAICGLTVLVWNDRANGRPGVIAVVVVVAISVCYHALVLERRQGGWSLFSTAAAETAS